MSVHDACIHARIGWYAAYCTRTRLVYVRPDKIPTGRGRKVRGDDADVFARHVREIVRAMKGIPVNGYVLMRAPLELPMRDNDLPDVIALRRHLAVESDEVNE